MIVAPWGESTLKSPKIVIIRCIFGHFKILIRYVHSTSWQYYELWVDLKSLKLGLIKFSKNYSTKDENFVCVKYIWTKLIYVTKYEK